jgi:hypothetical protein
MSKILFLKNISKDALSSIIIFSSLKKKIEIFNIFTNNTISGESTKVLLYCLL